MAHQRQPYLFRVIFLIIIAGLLAGVPGYAQNGTATRHTAVSEGQSHDTIRMTIAELETTYYFRLGKLVYTDAFSRLGYSFELYSFPSERALIEANSGRLDGEAGRITFDSVTAQKYPNLIRVPEVVVYVENAAFVLDSTRKFTGWKEIADGGLKVGYTRGSKSIEMNVRKYIRPELRFEFSDLIQGFEVLKRNRIDLLVGPNLSVVAVLRQPALRDITVFNAGVVNQLEIYPYLHEKHRRLLSPFAEVLRAMKKDGTLEQYMRDAETPAPSGNR